ncbi:short-subunit dehydrogenase [Saccharothrix tamanrassetensis]|uniref:Short-subunit dehydrogenase n=1 Tax=Saccharothrix tamanrassetensis TaxID=1051531 RepID=A0A841C9J2_9PSEU|nr:oxidoreductase [Saccharothrix tamanrassetensis]MBB5953821.1 short-subunit dehydrogenase [Saccharothrix tamanrassetensis]
MAAKVCLVTGASSGIGHATALELLRAGHTVYGAARRVRKMDALRAAGGRVLALDVTDEEALTRAVSTIVEEQHRIDVLVNNAGIGLHGAIEDVSLEQARTQFEVNVFAPARLVQLVLPHMREQGSGTIVNVSSIGGEIALPLGAWYYASKHALEAYSDTLRQEVKPFGVDVVLIQPGIIQTEFEDGTAQELRDISGRGAYRAVAEAMARRAETQLGANTKASPPTVVANIIRKAIESPTTKPRYAVGYLARTLLLLNRLLPDRTFDRLVTRTRD